MGYKILSQGVLDGACYMYSIMNAYKTLVCPDMDIIDFKWLKPEEKSGRKKWEYLIKICPQTTDMLAGLGFYNYISGIKTLDLDKVVEDQYNNFAQIAFNILSDNDHRLIVHNIKLEAIDTFDFSDAVIVIPIVKNIKTMTGNEIEDHFICINGRTDDKLHIICSATIHFVAKENYNEMFDSKNRRYFNNMIKIEDINGVTIGKGINSIYKVQRVTEVIGNE